MLAGAAWEADECLKVERHIVKCHLPVSLLFRLGHQSYAKLFNALWMKMCVFLIVYLSLLGLGIQHGKGNTFIFILVLLPVLL